MATLVPPQSKKQKVAEGKEAEKTAEPGPGVVVQFRNSVDGQPIGPPLTLGSDTERSGLELLVNKLRLANKGKRKEGDSGDEEDDEAIPFSFSLNTKSNAGEDVRLPIVQSIRNSFTNNGLSLDVEGILAIDCEPEAIFKVRPVTRCSSTLSGHTSSILCAAFSPTGKWLATGSGDATARIWDLNTETPRFTLSGHQNFLLSVEWDGLERTLATGSMDNTVRLWDPKTGKNKGDALRGHRKWITSLSWEPIHQNVYPRLASSSKDGTVRVWEASTTHNLCFSLGSHTASVNVVKWGGEGVIYTASSDCTVKLWDAKNGTLIRTLSDHAHWVNTLAINTDFILRTGPFDHRAITPTSDEQAKELALKRYKTFTKDQSEQIVTGSDDHTLFLWNTINSTSTKKPIARMTGHQRQVNHVAFSPDGRLIASAAYDKSVRLWDGRTGKFIATLRGHVAEVYRLSWSADSRMLVSASKDSTLKIWNLKTNKIKTDLPGHSDQVFCVDFVADKIASGGKDGKLKIWRH